MKQWLKKWKDNDKIAVYIGDKENFSIVEANEPWPLVPGPILFVSENVSENQKPVATMEVPNGWDTGKE